MKKLFFIFFSLLFLVYLSCIQSEKTVKVEGDLGAEPYVYKEVIDETSYEKATKKSFESHLDSILSVKDTIGELSFALQSGKTIVFYNKGKEDELEYNRYRYLGNLTKAYALFSVDHYENNELFFINLISGERFDLIGAPYANEELTYLFSYSNNYDIDYLDNDISLYKIKEDRLIRFSEIPSFGDSKPLEMFWIANDEIVLKFISSEDSMEPKYQYEKWKIVVDKS